MPLIHTCYRIFEIDRSVAFYEALGFTRRMRAVTIGLLVAAFAISSVAISGSTPPPHQAHPTATAASSR